MAGLPGEMTRAPLRTFRPQDLAEVYSQPSVQLHRLIRDPRVRKAAHGLYYTVPDDQDPTWMPTLEAVAAGVGTAIFGERVPVLMHLTAARLLGALPRAIGQAFVAVPRQRAPLHLTDRPAATVTFVARDVDALDAVLHPTDLGRALVTTPEQTALDLTRRPRLGGMPDDCRAAARVLLPRCDPERLEEIAKAQRMLRTLDRLRAENA
ncbi:type IV toxin-antitoxin system AbiEi family antitoxin [Geodermatophilus sp. SYSU D00758]